jgi:hypothetical protein
MITQSFYRIVVINCIWFVIFSTRCLSQPGVSRNAIYVEAFGTGIFYSVNYERFVSNDLTFRIGFSTFTIHANYDRDQYTHYAVPIMANYLIGEGNSKLEIGAGIEFLAGSGESTGDHTYFISTTPLSLSYVLLVGSFGYRYQPSDGGIHFRLVTTPFFVPKTGVFNLWFGSSIGICF